MLFYLLSGVERKNYEDAYPENEEANDGLHKSDRNRGNVRVGEEVGDEGEQDEPPQEQAVQVCKNPIILVVETCTKFK